MSEEPTIKNEASKQEETQKELDQKAQKNKSSKPERNKKEFGSQAQKNEPSKPERRKKELGTKEQLKKLKDKLPKGSGNFNFYWIYIVILVGLALMWFPNFTDITQKFEWPDFVETVLKP
ncbi:MAG: hypothetical protein AABZ32_05885, partial [Bacteroidota bacterium]